MATDLSKVVGSTIPDRPVAWNKRDLLTYALGVGAKRDEYSFIYELDPNFSALPTYPVVLALKGADQDVNLFASKSSPVPGLPHFDPNRIVHATQSVEILKPLPLVSGEGWVWKSQCTGIAENKSGLIVTSENLLVDPRGEVYAKLYSSIFNLGAKVTGERFSKVIAGPPQGKPVPKDRKADYVVEEETSPEQALIFRLSGDYNPLHVDPRIGEAGGFGGVILHGLSTFGFAGRAVLKTAGGGDPSAIKFFGVRFTAPVKPGDKLQTSIWEVGKGPNGTTEISFETKNLATGKVVLGSGLAYVLKKGKAKL